MGMLTGGKPYKLEMDIPYHWRHVESNSTFTGFDLEYRMGFNPDYIFPYKSLPHNIKYDTSRISDLSSKITKIQ